MMMQQQMPGMQQPSYVVVQSQVKNWEPSEWTSGLCGCCDDCYICCVSFQLGNVQYARNNEILTSGQVSFCSAWCTICMATAFGFGLCVLCGFRARLRDKFKINGGSCGDCCSHLFCSPCAIAQEAREIEARKQQAQEQGLPW